MILPQSHPIHRQQPARRGARAFTIAEMLVIIGIILLVAAIALPAFTAIVGSRSIESARNVVAASIVRARGEAIRRGQPCGVYFFVSPDTGRTGVALVTLDPLSDPDPYDEYKSFTRGIAGVTRDYQGGSYDPLNETNTTPPEDAPFDEPSMTADRVVTLGTDVGYAPTPDPYANFAGRPVIVVTPHTSADIGGTINPGLTDPGDTGSQPQPVLAAVNSQFDNSFGNDYWASPVGFGEVHALEVIDGIEPEYLASGASLQVVLGSSLEDTSSDGAADADGFKYAVPGPGVGPLDPDNPEFLERYARSGLILFDEEGHLIQSPYRIYASSRLGRVIGLDLVPDPTSTTTPPLMLEEYFPPAASAMGVVIYDQSAFEAAASAGTALVWKGGYIASIADPVTPFDAFLPTDGDVLFLYPPANRPRDLGSPTTGDFRFDEYAEERWLDANTIPLMVNRFSGTLVEGE